MESKLKEYWTIVKDFCKKFGVSVLFTLAVLFLGLSYIIPDGDNLENEVDLLEDRIQDRQEILHHFVQKAAAMPITSWLDLEDFPDDMVIYRYHEDTLQSWINQFPISNDEVDVLNMWYRINHLTSKSQFNTPLAYLSEREEYVNLGSAWYVVKVYIVGRTKIVSGLLIKTDYLSENSLLVNSINPNLGIKRKLILSPVSFDEGYVVSGVGGDPLFTVLGDVTIGFNPYAALLRWIAFFFVCMGLYFYMLQRRNFKAFVFYILGITTLWGVAYRLGISMRYISALFSPNIYADTGLFSSYGAFLLNNIYVFLVTLGIYKYRKHIITYAKKSRSIIRSSIFVFFLIVIIALCAYIHYVFNSLIFNSNVTLELFRLQELNIYSVFSYLSFGLLFASLLLMLQFLVPVITRYRRNTWFTSKFTFGYILLISLYTLVAVSVLGNKKESSRVKVWANKLSVERDIGLELQLRYIEGKLATDQTFGAMLSLPEGGANLVRNRLEEYYLTGISQKYEVTLTLCKPNDMLLDNKWQQMIDCNSYFNNLILDGIPLSDGSNFFFLNNLRGRVSYLGVLTYQTTNGPVNLYIQMDSRFTKDVVGYPALLFNYKPSDNVSMPADYSYAKYMDGRLVAYRGKYDYSNLIDGKGYESGFTVKKTSDGYLHYISVSSADNVIFVSRARRTLFVYLVSFSYLMLFYSAILFIIVRIRRWGRTSLKRDFAKNSFRRNITFLIIISLVVTLLCMGFGSVWFCMNFYKESNRMQMEEKMLTIQTTLSDICKYADDYTQVNNSPVIQAMERMANNTQADINLYDPYGRLIRSTQPELFDRYLLSSRMNANAYKQIVRENKNKVLNNEQLGKLSYYSLYAPIFNANGKLLAIANIPYFAKDSDFTLDASVILATIINIYILLLIMAILGGSTLANKISKPIAEISRKMRYIDVVKRAEHIDYKSDNELGDLVRSYNKMVDDVEASTAKLAQSEREQAWSEMARQIAHEIKNPLTPMSLKIQHLVRMKNMGVEGWEDKFEDAAKSILEQINILSNTASEFSSFAKFYYEETVEFNLSEVINEQKIFFDTQENIRIIYDYCRKDCMVHARKGQIIRVLVNLISNAIQALEETKLGYIRILLKENEGFYVVSIEDNGPGVKPEDEKKLFKPNFTTKSSGTGLGLAICRNILEQSGGKIFYTKSDLGGANFSFTLPK
ncbi:MAG: HAMP domain-containing sensor histidine kinase [Bacteroidia bacterium]|nr:HAMP domain-containing sensor histidine kinase [Bacteroidia bacterium]